MTGRRRRPSGGSHHDSGSTPTPRRQDTPHDQGGTPPPRNRDQGTTGGNGVGANLDTLDGMSTKLDTTRGKVEGVGDTVRGVNVGPKTMGVIGSGFAGAAESHLRTAERHVTRTTRAVEQAQAGTRGTTQAYRNTDATSAANLAAIDTPTPTRTKPSSSTTTPQSSTPTRTGDQTSTPSQPPRSISGTLDDGGTPPSPPPPPPPPGPPTPPHRPPIQHHDPSGKTIRTDNLSHPDGHLLDQTLLDQAANNPNRATDALAPGADMNHPAVQAIVPGTYHRDGFDANGNPMSRAQWEAQYWPNGTYDGRGNRDLTWPDPQLHPEGFNSPTDRAPAVLQPGQQIDRFGPGFGRFASPTDTPFPERGLPPDNLYDMRDPSQPGVNPNGPAPSYHRYEVIKPIPVWEGPIAPAMGQPGGGVQYYTPRAIIDLVNAGYLREVPL